MNDDYLWDRSGKPDPEIKQLEEILGELRYQPRPLAIPPQLRSGRNRFFYPRFAIAAAIAMVALSVGVWLAVERQRTTELPIVKQKQSTDKQPQRAAANPIDEKKLSLSASSHGPDEQQIKRLPEVGAHRHTVATNMRRARKSSAVSEMTAEQRAEAKKAKDDLMQVLRLASAKWNYAQKKMQGGTPANEVHNQHKIG